MAFLAAIPAAISAFAGSAATAATAATGLTGAQLLTGASALLSAGGSIFTGISNAQAANYQSEVSALNARIAADNAAAARTKSQEAQLEQDTLTMAQLGEQEALQSATGLGGRSQMLTRKAALTLGRQDALKTIATGEMDAYNFTNQSNAYAAESGAYKAKAGNSMLSGFLSGATSLVSGASSIANPNRYNAMQRKA
jgi:hypothetical protein